MGANGIYDLKLNHDPTLIAAFCISSIMKAKSLGFDLMSGFNQAWQGLKNESAHLPPEEKLLYIRSGLYLAMSRNEALQNLLLLEYEKRGHLFLFRLKD